MRSGAAAMLGAVLCACASVPETEVEEKIVLVCTKEQPTGSKMTVRRCETVSRAEEERSDAAAFMKGATRQTKSPQDLRTPAR
jgi:hypothetical protein